MSNIKQTIMAAAVAVAFVTTAQADGLSDSLPLGKSLAAGQELPLPLGISANVFFLEQNMEAQSIAINLPDNLVPGLPPGLDLPAKATKLESRATSTTAKIDAWVLPFLNVYGVAGYVDGETSASGFSLQPLTSPRSEEHTSELQSRRNIVCRLLLATKNAKQRPLRCGHLKPQ